MFSYFSCLGIFAQADSAFREWFLDWGIFKPSDL